MNLPISGTKDFIGDKYSKFISIIQFFIKTMELHGFNGIEFPILESAKLYMDTLGSTSDVVSKEMFYAICLNEKNYDTVLRPEGTMSCIRALINAGKIQEKSGFYYAGHMFRHNRPQKHRGRQFYQLGCEIFNKNSIFTDFELISSIFLFLKKLNINATVYLNLIPNQNDLLIYKNMLCEYFETNKHCLSPENQSKINPLRILDKLSKQEKCLLHDIPSSINFTSKQDRGDFDTLCQLLDAKSINYNIDHSLVRGLDYYQGTVFEIQVDDLVIAGGGRYFVSGKRFGINADISGCGYSIGLERIFDLAHVVNNNTLIIVGGIDQLYGLHVSEILRSLNKRTLFVFGNMSYILKTCFSAKPSYLIIAGQDECINHTVKIKNWATKEENIVNLCALANFEFTNEQI